MNHDAQNIQIGAVVLAAGQSKRMKTPKMVLPWGDGTVIEQVISTLTKAGLRAITVVTGGDHEKVESALAGTPVQFCHNPDFTRAEMLGSIQTGLRCVNPALDAVLIVLGDQPFITEDIVRRIIGNFSTTRSGLIVPSYQMRRGHPWLVERGYWPEILALGAEKTPRDFLHRHAAEIIYLPVDTPDILKDLDTPEDYRRERPG